MDQLYGDVGLNYEYMARMFLGDKADHIAGEVNSPVSRRRRLRSIVKKLMHRLEQLDLPGRQQQSISRDLEAIDAALRATKVEVEWGLVFSLFRLCGRLFGYDYIKGSALYTPFYYQEKDQYYTQRYFAGGDVFEDYEDEKDFISIRLRLIEQLKSEGYTDQKIALILNTTEYRVKRLKKGI